MSNGDRKYNRRGRPDERPEITSEQRAKAGRRVMPHNLDCEASILGGILLRNETLALIPMLEVDDFYDMRHRIVFQAIRNLEAATRPIDVVTVENEIDKAGKLEAIGGMATIGELALRVPTPDNVETYTKIVIDHRITRDVMLMLAEKLEDGYAGAFESDGYVHDISASLMRIRTAKDIPIITIADLAHAEGARVLSDLERRAKGEMVYAGVPTGYQALDERCGGHPIGVSTLYIARPGAGKSTHAMAIAKSSKRIANMDSLIASYEDSGISFGQRALGQESGLATEHIRARQVGDRESMYALTNGMAAARSRGELFVDCAGMTVEQLVRRVRRETMLRQARGLAPIKQLIVDYIQKMPIPEWARTRDEGVGHISRTLSTFASTDSMAVVIMCQLNRESEKRDDHRPRLSDIRDSGSLEQDGKLIMGIYHPFSYDGKTGKHRPEDVYLIMLKNAQGEANLEIPLYWERATHAIYNDEVDYQRARAARPTRGR